MDHTYIVPFVVSVQKVFSTMLQLPVQIGAPFVKKPGQPSHDVSGIIGMSGDLEGAVALSFPTATAERVVSLFTGGAMTVTHEDFGDAVGELVNMISGSAKAQFKGKTVSISCPTVVVGSDHVVFGSKDIISIIIPCACDCGEFSVEVSIRNDVKTATPAPATAATGSN